MPFSKSVALSAPALTFVLTFHAYYMQHIDLFITYVWETQSVFLQSRRLTIVDSMFTSILTNKFMSYKKAPQNVEFVWHPLLVSYVAGVIDQRCINLQWIKDVDPIYLPMNWGKRHWVGLVVDLIKGHTPY